MLFILLEQLAVAANIGLIRREFLSIDLHYWGLAYTIIEYIFILIILKFKIAVNNADKYIILFILYGLFAVVLSFANVYEFFGLTDLWFNDAFILRQAFYLVYFPIIILWSKLNLFEKIILFIYRNNTKIIYAILIISFIYSRSISIDVTTISVVCFLNLLNRSNKKHTIFIAFICTFTPYTVGGEITNILIRLVHIFCLTLFSKDNMKVVFYGINTAIILTLVAPVFSGFIINYMDANSAWRLLFWQDEIVETAKTFFMGTGYGTSYISTNFMNSVYNVPFSDMSDFTIVSGPFEATDTYSTYDKLFVTGSHNSFVSVFFRLGLAGFFLLMIIIKKLQDNIYNNISCLTTTKIFALVSAICIILVNVGLENPSYLHYFIFAFTFCNLDTEKLLLKISNQEKYQ